MIQYEFADVYNQSLRPPAAWREESGQIQALPQIDPRQPLRRVAQRDRVEFELQRSLRARFRHASLVRQVQFQYRDAGRRMAQIGTGRERGAELNPIQSPRRAAYAAACSEAAFLASSRSTTFIIGDGAVSAFFMPTVRCRSTASL